MEPSAYLDLLDERSSALLEAARTAPAAPVPSCPGWTVEDVVRHCGAVWGWAAECVRTGKRADFPEEPPRSGEELRSWAADQAQELLGALRQSDPEANCWTFGEPRSARFWFRRQALETALHAWDAEHAAGLPAELPSEVAADGLDEFLEVAVSRQVSRDPGSWQGESVHFHRTDGEGEWLVRLGAGPVKVERSHGRGDLAVRGAAPDLFLWATGRSDAEHLELFGDVSLAERWATQVRF